MGSSCSRMTYLGTWLFTDVTTIESKVGAGGAGVSVVVTAVL